MDAARLCATDRLVHHQRATPLLARRSEDMATRFLIWVASGDGSLSLSASTAPCRYVLVPCMHECACMQQFAACEVERAAGDRFWTIVYV
jgi:hypothetical protein